MHFLCSLMRLIRHKMCLSLTHRRQQTFLVPLSLSGVTTRMASCHSPSLPISAQWSVRLYEFQTTKSSMPRSTPQMEAPTASMSPPMLMSMRLPSRVRTFPFHVLVLPWNNLTISSAEYILVSPFSLYPIKPKALYRWHCALEITKKVCILRLYRFKHRCNRRKTGLNVCQNEKNTYICTAATFRRGCMQ